MDDQERDKIEREQGEQMLRAIQAIREAEAARREALRQALEAGMAARQADERRQRDEGGSGP